MRKGDMTIFLGLLFRPPRLRSYSYEYFRRSMPDYFVSAFIVSAVFRCLSEITNTSEIRD